MISFSRFADVEMSKQHFRGNIFKVPPRAEWHWLSAGGTGNSCNPEVAFTSQASHLTTDFQLQRLPSIEGP